MSLPPSGWRNHDAGSPDWSNLFGAVRVTSAFFLLVPASIFSLYGALRDPEDTDAMLTGVIGFALCVAFLYPANPATGPSAPSFTSRHRLLAPRLWDDLRATPVLAAAHTALTGVAAYVLYRAPGLGARQMFYGHVAGGMGLLPYLLDRALGRARLMPRYPPDEKLTPVQRHALEMHWPREDLQGYRTAVFQASWSRAHWLLVATWEGSLALFQWNLGRLLWHQAGGAPHHARHGMTGPSMQINTYLLESVAGTLFHTLHLNLNLPLGRIGRTMQAGLRLAAIAGRYHRMVGGAPLLIVLGLEGLALCLRRELWRPALSGRPYAIPAFFGADSKAGAQPGRPAPVMPPPMGGSTHPGPSAGPSAGPGTGPVSTLNFPGPEGIVVIQLHDGPVGGRPPISAMPRAWGEPEKDPAEGI